MVKPEKILKRICEITPELLIEENIQGILVDMDNTLLPWHEDKVSDESKKWIVNMQKSGIKICIITNSGIDRTRTVMKDVGVKFIHTALKPLPFNFIRGRKILGVPKKNICVIGDQLVTDVLGAKIAGLKSILVEPMSQKEHRATHFTRFLERVVLGRDVRKTYDDK